MFKPILRIFTWWNGFTIGTWWYTLKHGVKIGEDDEGNRYYRSRKGDRRWVIYNGVVEASKIPPEWHAWLHRTVDDPPSEAPPAVKSWEKAHESNPTGTEARRLPAGSLARGGERPKATGDYEPWKP